METLEKYDVQILETAIALAVLLLINFVVRKSSQRVARKLHLEYERGKITIKIVNLLLILVGFVTISGIWGVDQKELFLFLTSVLTVLGVGFFASWSILSNITSGLLLYFNHPLHIGDYIKILDKELPVEGTIKDISMFFMHIETNEGEYITIPNSIIMQKTISWKEMANGKRRERPEKKKEEINPDNESN